MQHTLPRSLRTSRCLFVLCTVAMATVAACDTGDVESFDALASAPSAAPVATTAEAAPPHDSDDADDILGASVAAPLTFDVIAPNGNTITFVEVEAGVVAVAEGGSADNEPVLDRLMRGTASPAELYQRLTQRPAPQGFAEMNHRVVAADTWLGLAGSPTAAVVGAQTTPTAASAPFCSTSWIEGKARAYNRDAANRARNASTGSWFLSKSNKKSISQNDILGAKAAICVKQGRVLWRFRKKNCTACNYSTVFEKQVPAGHWYYAYYYNNRNDFKARSWVQGLDDDGNVFNTRLASCRDYWARVLWTSNPLASCHIGGSGEDYAQHGRYVGPDPSNIATGAGMF